MSITSSTSALRSRLEDEGHCITINADESRSRSAVAIDLATLQQSNPVDSTYIKLETEDTIHSNEEVIPTTIISLAQGDDSNRKPFIYALSTGESVATGHARDMAKWRDQYKDRKIQLNIEHLTDIVRPSENTQKDMEESQHQCETADVAPSVSMPTTSRGVKKTVTTAANFFADKQKSTVNKVEKPTKVEQNSTATDTSAKQSAPVPEEKENQTKKNIGRVDIFEGDDEEDEDDVDADDKPVAAATVPVKRRAILDDDNQVPESLPHSHPKIKPTKKSQEVMHGAMDDFVAEKPPAVATSSSKSGKKKIKKTIQKTTMDEKGYIHTENVEIWEEVDEDEPTVAPTPLKKAPVVKNPVKKNSQMKQGNLMGFFQPKKK